VAAAHRVRARERHDLAVVEAHAREDVPQALSRRSAMTVAAVGGGEATVEQGLRFTYQPHSIMLGARTV